MTLMFYIYVLPCRWEAFPEFAQERSSVNVVSVDGELFVVGGFTMIGQDKECVPSEITDIWQ